MPPVVDRPLFFLDYDGTLAPIVDDPSAAVPHPDVPDLLRRLEAQHPLWIVTGRDIAALSQFLDRSYRAIGLHGAQEGTVGGETRQLLPDKAVRALRRLRTSVPTLDGLEVEEKNQTFAVHYRAVADAETARERLSDWLIDLPDALDVVWGKKVVELRPAGLTKGTAVERIAEEHPECIPVYLGDDTTDEDAFEALHALDREVVTVKVGDGETGAAHRLAAPDAVADYLRLYL